MDERRAEERYEERIARKEAMKEGKTRERRMKAVIGGTENG